MKTIEELLHVKVSHQGFGTGSVIDIKSDMITIDFPNHGEKRFVYPESFEQFLNISDNPELQEFVSLEIKRKKDALEVVKTRLKQEHDDAQLARVQEKKKKTTRKPKTKV